MHQNVLWGRFVSLLIIILLFFSSCSRKEMVSIPKTTKTKNPIHLDNGEKVINTYFFEVMRKDEINRIDLVAKNDKAPFFYALSLLIDGVKYQLKEELKGYSPLLTVADFTDDGLIDLKVTIKSGNTDSSLIFGIYHFQKREFTSLLDDDLEKGIVPLQISWFSENILQYQSQKYQINGKKTIKKANLLEKKTKIGLSPYESLEAIDIDDDFQAELIGIQSIWIDFPYHKILTFRTVLKFEQDQWKLLEYRFIEVPSN